MLGHYLKAIFRFFIRKCIHMVMVINWRYYCLPLNTGCPKILWYPILSTNFQNPVMNIYCKISEFKRLQILMVKNQPDSSFCAGYVCARYCLKTSTNNLTDIWAWCIITPFSGAHRFSMLQCTACVPGMCRRMLRRNFVLNCPP